MICKVQKYQWRLLGSGLVLSLVLAAWMLVSLGLTAKPGSIEHTFAYLRTGMSQGEAIASLQTCTGIDTFRSEGLTQDGKPWTRYFSFDGLPPASDVASGVLQITDNEGRDLDVILGPGGVVSGKRLAPGPWQYRLHKAIGVLDQARYDLSSASWWNDQLRKAQRSVHRR
jgi:hypothetical protein